MQFSCYSFFLLTPRHSLSLSSSVYMLMSPLPLVRQWNDCARSSFCVGVLGLGVQLVRPDGVLGPGVRRVVLHVARLPRSRDPGIEVEF